MNSRNLTAIFVLSIILSVMGCGTMNVASRRVAEEVIESKLLQFNLGSRKEDMLYELGDPSYIVVIPQPDYLVEVYGYEYGRNWSSVHPILIFKDNRFIGAVNRPVELLKILQVLRVIPAGTIWDQQDELPYQ